MGSRIFDNMHEFNKKEAFTLLGKCFLDLSKKKSWWYSINDPNDESSIASALDLDYADYTNSLLNLGLLKISRRGAIITTSKGLWVNYFTLQNIENYEFENKKKTIVINGKDKRLNLYYLQLGVSQDNTKCNPSNQIHKRERRPRSIPHVLLKQFHQSMDLPSECDQSSTDCTTSGTLSSFDKPNDESTNEPETTSLAQSNPVTDTAFTPQKRYMVPQDLLDPKDRQTMNRLLSDIVAIHKQHDLSIEYESWNGTKMLLVPVPSVGRGGYKGFCDSTRKYQWLDTVLDHIAKGDKDKASMYLLTYLAKKFEHNYLSVAREIGVHVSTKMNEFAAGAMWTAAGVTQTAAKTILRHLHAALGCRIQVPMPKVKMLGDGYPTPVFDVFHYKSEAGKVKEEVNYWVSDVCEVLSQDMARVINNNEDKSKQNTYGYSTLTNSTPVCDVIIGADHGQGAVRCSLKINLLPPSERRKNCNSSLGSRTFPWAHISCKKDTHTILALLNNPTNKAIRQLKYGKLIGIRDNNGTVTCVVISRLASEMSVIVNDNDQTQLQFMIENKMHEININVNPTGEHTLWTIIPQFRTFICGDLAYYFTVMGRDGHSTCKCPYCTLTITEWKNTTNVTPSQPMTLSLILESLRSKQYGVKMEPFYNIEPLSYISPILHIQMGLVNLALEQLSKFIDASVENVSEEERTIRVSVMNSESNLNTVLSTLKNDDAKKKDLALESRELARLIKSTRNDNTQPPDVIAAWVHRQEECVSEQREVIVQMAQTQKEVTLVRKQLKKDKETVKRMRKGRVKDAIGFEVEIEQILGDKAKIYKEAYHGGTLNGVCCIRLLEKNKSIMDEVKIMCERRRLATPEEERLCTHEFMIDMLDQYARLFNSLDTTFGYLRIIDPNEEELINTAAAVRITKAIWLKLGFSITPKAHILFEHVCDQQREYGGLADKCEDWIEQSHQTGMRLEYLTSRMPKKYESKQLTQLSIFWRQSNPSVEQYNRKAMELTSRKRKVSVDTPTIAVRNKMARKTVKLERRSGFLVENSLLGVVVENEQQMQN